MNIKVKIMSDDLMTPDWDNFFLSNPAPADLSVIEAGVRDFLSATFSGGSPAQPVCLVTSGNLYQEVS